MAITKIYKGNVERSDIQKIYKGTTLLYEKVLSQPPALFYGGSSQFTVVKADLDNLSTLNTSVSYGNRIHAIAVDDTYIYVGGYTTRTVKKYLKSDLTYIGESPSYGFSLISIALDDT